MPPDSPLSVLSITCLAPPLITLHGTPFNGRQLPTPIQALADLLSNIAVMQSTTGLS